MQSDISIHLEFVSIFEAPEWKKKKRLYNKALLYTVLEKLLLFHKLQFVPMFHLSMYDSVTKCSFSCKMFC